VQRKLIVVPQFKKEWSQMIQRYRQYRKKLEKRFLHLTEVLRQQGSSAINSPNFGDIEGSGQHKLYKMVISTKKPNIRVIFTILDTHKQEGIETIVLLTVFYEKEKNDYKEAIGRANERIKAFFH